MLIKDCFKKGLVFGIIFLFIGTGFSPIISGNNENKYKTDLTDSSLFQTNLWVIGFMQIINKTSDYLEVINIFGFWITQGSYGGFFEPNQLLYIYGFKGIAIGRIVIGKYDNITIPA